MFKQELSLELVNIMTETGHFFTKKELLRLVQGKWTELADADVNLLAKEVFQLLNAIITSHVNEDGKDCGDEYS